MNTFHRLFTLLLSGILAWISSPISANVDVHDLLAENKEVVIGYIEFPPVFFTNEEGKPEGYLIDLARMLMEKRHYSWRAVSRPTRRMAIELADGKIDLWIGLSTLPEFTGTTLVGDSIVARIELNAYWQGDKKTINHIEDLVGESVVLLHGFSYGGAIRFLRDPVNRIRDCSAFNHAQAIGMLKVKRCDYLLNYDGPMRLELKKQPVQDLRRKRLSSLDARFVVSKKRDHAAKLLNDLESALNELVAEGKWFLPPP
ncbi:transporter substrate-binding domain-containing protein [Hahella aquimaris]|uniref:substrate-binding periplasmic protein n=1 Tax=Hahella sp. HNIBRBA332 TaxID=3015983 RepID=UPI00273B831D|nr:transporter substrate-binding domain-containing protein [Hahella sp. HNIBRBA332]WLQ12807.1 transporter substrate-binding domain-containing protein [Hahella sp. HNIBRBA332]